jgi:hypothetical protein
LFAGTPPLVLARPEKLGKLLLFYCAANFRTVFGPSTPVQAGSGALSALFREEEIQFAERG